MGHRDIAAFVADNQMIEDVDAEQLSRLGQALLDAVILPARRWIPGRVIVNKDDCRR